MGKHMNSKYAICPYYLHEDKQMIYCEGVEENAVTHQAFANASNSMLYKTKYCRKDYSSCLIKQMLDKKYEKHN